MSDFIPRWWQGLEELEKDIEYNISDVILDVKALNA